MNAITKSSAKKWILRCFVLYVLTLSVNYLGSTGWINGMSQADLSNKYTTLITPAGFTFSIWGLIYFSLLLTLTYWIVRRNDHNAAQNILMIGPLFALSCLLNMAWIIVFSYEIIWLSLLIILALLISLMLIVKRLVTHRKPIHFIPLFSFSLYAGWVLIASVVNTAVLLVKSKWQGFGISPSIWTIVILCLVILFVLFYQNRYRNVLFPLSPAWAFWGIYQSYQKGTIQASLSSQIQLLLVLGISIFLIAMLASFWKNAFTIIPKKTY